MPCEVASGNCDNKKALSSDRALLGQTLIT